MVDKARIQVIDHRNRAARAGSLAVVGTWSGVRSIHLHGQDRRGEPGALPWARTAGFHASRFALAYPHHTRVDQTDISGDLPAAFWWSWEGWLHRHGRW